MAIDFSKFASWDMPVYMNRQNPIPLDKSSVFNTLAEAESYASTSKIAYDGQFLAVTEDGVVKTYVIENKALKEIGSSKAAADSLKDAVDKMSPDNLGDIIYVTEDTYVYKDENGKKVYVDSVDDIPSDKKFDEGSAAEYNAAHATEEGFEPVAAGDIKPDAGVDVYGPGAYIVSGDKEVEKLAQSNPGSADLDSEVAALKSKVESKLDASVLNSDAFKFGFSPDDANTLVLNIGDKTADIDLSKFAIDGMLQSVVLVKEDVEGVSEKAPYFEFTWNCDIDADYEGEQNVIRVELGDILDSAIADKADSSALAALRKEIFGEGEGDDRTEGLVDRISAVESALDADAEGSLASKVAALEDDKADSNHVHDLSELTDTTNILDSKAAADHTHTIADVAGLSDKLSDAENRLAIIEDGLGVPKYYETADAYNDAHLIPDEEGNIPGEEGYVETYEDGFEPVSDEDFANLPESDKLMPSDGSLADVLFSEDGLVNTVENHDVALEEMSSVLYGDNDDNNNGLVGDVEDLQDVVGDSESGLVKDVADLTDVVGDSESGLVKDVADIASDVEDLKSAVTGVFRFAGKLDEVPSLDDMDEEELESLVGSVIVVGDDEWALAAPFDDEDDYHWVNLGHDSLTDKQIDSIWDDVFRDKIVFYFARYNKYLYMDYTPGMVFADVINANNEVDWDNLTDNCQLYYVNYKKVDGGWEYEYDKGNIITDLSTAGIDMFGLVTDCNVTEGGETWLQRVFAWVRYNNEYVDPFAEVIPNVTYVLEEMAM